MAVNKYLRGRVVRVSVEVRDDAGALSSAGALTLRVMTPAGVTTTYNNGFTNPSTGIYYLPVTGSAAGRWCFRWETTTPTGAAEGEFTVEQGEFS
jgi:hypothetical protein